MDDDVSYLKEALANAEEKLKLIARGEFNNFQPSPRTTKEYEGIEILDGTATIDGYIIKYNNSSSNSGFERCDTKGHPFHLGADNSRIIYTADEMARYIITFAKKDIGLITTIINSNVKKIVSTHEKAERVSKLEQRLNEN
jgi:hypothetical protein